MKKSAAIVIGLLIGAPAFAQTPPPAPLPSPSPQQSPSVQQAIIDWQTMMTIQGHVAQSFSAVVKENTDLHAEVDRLKAENAKLKTPAKK